MSTKQKLELYIPRPHDGYMGGPKTFLTNLLVYLGQKKIIMPESIARAKHIFFPIKYESTYLKRIKDRGGKVIQRLDGVWYPEKHNGSYKQINQPVKEIYQYLADFVIFQSEYSKRQVFGMFGERDEDSYTIIINGVDKSIFYCDTGNNRSNSEPFKFITTGRFRDMAMLEPVVLALDSIANEVAFELHIVGEVVNEELNLLLDRNYIVKHGTLELQGVADQLRQSDIFIYSHLNPPCPNSVIEAISCGLPVVSFDSGAMGELLPFGKDLLAPVSDKLFHADEDFDWEALADKLQYAVDNFDILKKRAVDHAYLYSFEECGRAYLEVFQKVTGQIDENKKGRLRSYVNSCTMDNTLAIGERFGLGSICRSIAIELLRRSSREDFLNFMERALRTRIEGGAPSDALWTMFDLDKKIYGLEGKEAIRYDDGVHTKHRHIGYHSFFVENVNSAARVLDLGCGKGELAYSVSKVVTEGLIYGLDRNKVSIEFARKNYGENVNLKFVLGDINDGLPGEEFDVVLLSNVLEHVEYRVELLAKIRELFNPRQILIRVPLYQRDWRIPLQDELNFDYRLDLEHYIEYTPESFHKEISSAGYEISHEEFRWGEIWAKVTPLTYKVN